jgi:type IV secretion system protein TrbI
MTDDISPRNEPEAKLDPESLILRGKPSPVIRFKRGVLIGIAALGSVAIIGVTWVALQPAALKLVSESQSQADLNRKRPPEALAGAPATYGDIPKLGPPLPGDLGRPILVAQQKMATEADPAVGMDAAAQAAEAERQRLLAEERKVREAGVMMSLAQSSAPQAASSVVPADLAENDSNGEKAGPMLDPERDPNAQGNKIAFTRARGDDEVVNPHRQQRAASPHILSAGSVISASLITGLNSDLPGFVTAQVTENVYDSPSGRTLLLP